MDNYLVLDPIKHNQVSYLIGSTILLDSEVAAALPVSGPVDAVEVIDIPEVIESTVEPISVEGSDRINANTALVDELTAINGLGPSMASAIVELRPIDDLAILSEIPRFRDEWLDQMEV